MTYRDDHDAALARADALADELARVRHQAVVDASRLACVELERDQLAQQLAAHRARPLPDAPVESVTPPAARVAPYIIGIAIAIAALFGFAITMSTTATGHPSIDVYPVVPAAESLPPDADDHWDRKTR